MGIEGFSGIAMLVRARSFLEWRIPLTAMLMGLATAQPAAQAQGVNGAMAVSVTILPPIPTQATRLISFDMGRDGIGRLETTAPVARSVSQIVMWTVSSSANGFVPVEQAPMLIEATSLQDAQLATWPRESPSARLRYEVRLGGPAGPPGNSSSRDVTVRVSYVIVPGT